jgi:hypothetical protein
VRRKLAKRRLLVCASLNSAANAIDQELAMAVARLNLLTTDKPPAPLILTESQTRILIRALELKEGIDMASAPRITTLSGRQARISFEHRVASFEDEKGIFKQLY